MRVHFPEGPTALMTIPRPTLRDAYTQWTYGTDIPTESTAEILARMLQSRILDLGVFTDRDLYDLLVAQEQDLEALRRVLASVTNAERATIASELRGLPRHWTSGEPVRAAAYPSVPSGPNLRVSAGLFGPWTSLLLLVWGLPHRVVAPCQEPKISRSYTRIFRLDETLVSCGISRREHGVSSRPPPTSRTGLKEAQ